MATKPDVVLVSGANRGLGLEFARQYAADGWQVLAACRSPDSAKELQKLAKESDGRIRVFAMDVTNAASVSAAAAELKGEAIDLLLNNAGVMGPRSERLGESRLRGLGPRARCQHAGTDARRRGFPQERREGPPEEDRHDHERHGIARGQHQRRVVRLSQLESGGEHGGARASRSTSRRAASPAS